jgi:hypothetical protein
MKMRYCSAHNSRLKILSSRHAALEMQVNMKIEDEDLLLLKMKATRLLRRTVGRVRILEHASFVGQRPQVARARSPNPRLELC